MRQICVGRPWLNIAHRLSLCAEPTASCHGARQIVEEGSHDELLGNARHLQPSVTTCS
jgi:ABC-type transport system involved in Fe-S cluster assembly fused permease/ATPase subunit